MVSRQEVTWVVARRAADALRPVRDELGSERYEVQANALKDFLCGYFEVGACNHKQGGQISPMRSTPTAPGGKCLKVRWGYPGSGKSGGLRLAVVVFCDRRHVVLAGAWMRKDDPTAGQFEAAIADV